MLPKPINNSRLSDARDGRPASRPLMKVEIIGDRGEITPRLVRLPQRQAMLGIVGKVGHGARIAVGVRLFLAHGYLRPCYRVRE